MMLRSLMLLATLAVVAPVRAHFAWLYVTDSSEPRLFFGEGLDSKDYHLPDTIASAEVWQDAIDAPAKRLTMEPLEEDGFNGLESDSSVEPRGVIKTTVEYGNYHGSRLTYDAQHFPAENPEAWPKSIVVEGGLSAVLRVEVDQLFATIFRDGKPLAGVKATLTNEAGGDGIQAESDDSGVAEFNIASIRDGLNGLMVMHVDKEAAGEIDGKPFKSATRILTATFNYQAEKAAKVSALTPLPQAIASFGAAVSDGWLYVYGGHIGQAHDHSRENLSKAFLRISLNGGDWEELPSGPPLQGLPMVAHDGKLYRIGGLDARNPSGEDEDLHSVADFARYDPATNEWTDLEPLPGPRSSHNAVVIEGTLYVVGGWALSGDSDGDWQSGALSYDLTAAEPRWETLPEPPFKRRAFAVSHIEGRVAVLCGMTDEADLSKQVFFYEPESKEWTEGPEFPGNTFHGFGLAAWNLDGNLYAGGMEGVLYRLSDDQSAWRKIDEFQTQRFFHQLVPDGRGGLLAVAGASPSVGHTGSIERLDLVDAETSSDDDAEQPASQPDPSVDPEPSVNAAESEPASVERKSAAISSEACPADRWPGFRGVGTSVTASSDLPLTWSDDQGIAWEVDLPGYGQSSPVVWGNRVFITTMQGDEKETPTLLCYDLVSGEELWKREYSASQKVTASNYVSRAAPTPCLDGQHVYALFESGDLFAHTHDGELVWQRSLVDEYGAIQGNHGIGGSPVLAGGTLLVPMLHGGPSYLLAARIDNGETAWKSDFAARVAWSSPCVANGKVILSGAGSVDAFDAKTGEPSWRIETLEGNNVPSPTLAGDVILVGSQERSSNLAIRLGPDAAADIAWRGDKATSSFASPLIYRGHAYYVSKAGVAHCLDVRDGRVVCKDRLPASCWASPLACADRIYFFTKDGATVVYSAEGSARRVAENDLAMEAGERVYGIAAVSSRVLVRTGTTLTCID